MSELRTISKLAHEAGVNVETVRYYERRGLIRQPAKRAEGWRHYDDDAVRRIRFIKRAQQLGFSLDDIDELLALRSSKSEARCARVRARAAAKLEEIERRIADLTTMRMALEDFAATCRPSRPGPCPLIEALDATPESSTVVH